MAVSTRYFRGQGTLFVSGIGADGMPTNKMRDVGNVSELMIDINQSMTEHQESQTGERRVDLRIVTGTTITMTATIESINRQNWQMALQGDVDVVAAQTVTDEEHETGATKSSFALNYKNLATFDSLKVKGGATLVEGTDYSIRPPSNVVTIVSTAAAKKVIQASYTTGVAETVSAFNAINSYKYFYFDGLNTVENKQPVAVELFKVDLDRTIQIGLISDNLIQFQLKGQVLYGQ